MKNDSTNIHVNCFVLYYRKNIFSTINLLKSKRVSLYHKRKLPSLIKFRKKTITKQIKKNKQKIHTNNIRKTSDRLRIRILTLNTGHTKEYKAVSLFRVLYWYPSLYDMHFNQGVSACLGLCFACASTPLPITVHPSPPSLLKAKRTVLPAEALKVIGHGVSTSRLVYSECNWY